MAKKGEWLVRGTNTDEPVHDEVLRNRRAQRAQAREAIREAAELGLTPAEARQAYGVRGRREG